MKKLIGLFCITIAVLLTMSFIERGAGDQLSIYPQPIVSKTRVTADFAISKIEVYNLLGVKVVERDNQGEVDFSSVPTGYYIIKAYTEKGEIIKRVHKN